MKELFGTFILGFTVASSTVFAQTITNQNRTATDFPNLTKYSDFSANVNLQVSSNLYETNSYQQESGLNLTVVPAYKIQKDLTLSLSASVDQNLKENQGTTLSNTKLTLSHLSLKTKQETRITTRIFTIAPTNTVTTQKDTLMGTIGLGGDISFVINGLTLPTRLTLGFDLQENFHEYNFSSSGTANAQYVSKNSAELSTDLSNNINLSISGFYRTGRSYGGMNRYVYAANTELNYIYNKQITLSAGTSNDGLAWKANGTDSNMDFFNENNMKINAGITLIL